MNPIDILIKYWGHTIFRPKQELIIDNVLNQQDVLALLPTGGGKSVCYQIPALIKEGVCIVISPLISLMQDQIKHLKSKGIKSISVSSSMSYSQTDTALTNCIYGGVKFLFLSPELTCVFLFGSFLISRSSGKLPRTVKFTLQNTFK